MKKLGDWIVYVGGCKSLAAHTDHDVMMFVCLFISVIYADFITLVLELPNRLSCITHQ
jgi:hypothetical protein